MQSGTQLTATITGGQTKQWWMTGWDPTKFVVWYVMPTTVKGGAPEISWSIEVERATATTVTYWLTVVNRTTVDVNFEARYTILN